MDQDRVVPHEFGQGVRMMDTSQKRREEEKKEHIPALLAIGTTRYAVVQDRVQLDPADRIQPGRVAHACKVQALTGKREQKKRPPGGQFLDVKSSCHEARHTPGTAENLSRYL